ncbi:pilus assembly protein [Phyllobacterium phragmitis]|uniref:Pilus assembly protein n=1 Tax=Phyllobacterium phragmitis TaxID=2670329 RepID=A0A2S9IUI9_9HYPH|nr:TadE/TadG family type IV pilus assembly protein [Phyllobacterium phragmitis]PRD44199.1 pilus assembly protein [Phyllobacterium phragmitis]
MRGANFAAEPETKQSRRLKITARVAALLRGFRRDRSGTTAIEFAVLIFPFMLLLFSIIEVSVSFMGQQLLSDATDKIARQLRTGELKAADMTSSKLHDMICTRLEILVPFDCPELSANLKTYTSYAGVPKSGLIDATGQLSLGNTVSPGGRGSINQLNVLYRWPLLTDIMRRQMQSAGGDGKLPLFATNTWQNEPYELD